MSSIQPTSGINSAAWANLKPAAAQPVEKPALSGFGDLVKNSLDSVQQQQDKSATAIGDLIAGRGDGVLPVVEAVAKADLSFKLLMGVRNKVIEAYKQTMNMQV